MNTVALLITRPEVGGAQAHCYTLMHSLRHRYSFHLGTSGSGWLTDRARELGVPVTLFPELVVPIAPWCDLRATVQVRRWLRRLRPALLHVHSAKAAIVGRIAAASACIPAMYTVHGWAFTEGVSSLRRIQAVSTERVMSLLPARIVTVSQYDRSLAIRSRLPGAERIQVIPNGLPDTDWRADRRLKTDIPVHIIMVARFEDPKDQSLLVRALSTLQELPWTLELPGDGPTLTATKDLVMKLALERRVSFPGACTDVPRRLAQADIAVLASNWEALPLTIIEAMRASLPVVASNVGGIPELVDHDKNGLLFGKGNAAELVEALRALIMRPERRRQLGECGRKRYEREFTEGLMAERVSKVYESIMRMT